MGPTVQHAYPPDLACCVRERWQADMDGLPEPDALERLLSITYQASLLREEERPVIFRMILAAPSWFPADAGPPSGLHRLLFTRSRPLDAAELRRLSPAVEYHRGLIGVRADERGGFEIWGTLQSGLPWVRAARGGRAQPSALPPALVVCVRGPGQLTVTRGAEPLCELSGGRLGGPSVDVFTARWLAEVFLGMRAELAALHIAARSRAPAPWAELPPELIGLVAPQMLKRLITAVRGARHGGMLLLVPSVGAGGSDALLRIKYEFHEEEPRRRYRTLVLAAMRAQAVLHRRAHGAARDQRDRATDARIQAADEALLELSSLIASLANVDGAVVLTPAFELIGFGCEIGGEIGDVITVRRALDLEGTRWAEEDAEAVGTRHRAAYRLCQRRRDAVAIVVSQDGTVRFVAWRDGGVTYWDTLVDSPTP